MFKELNGRMKDPSLIAPPCVKVPPSVNVYDRQVVQSQRLLSTGPLLH